jgi:hypothetical protein
MEVNCGFPYSTCLAKTEVINQGAKKIMAVKTSKWEIRKPVAKATTARLFFLSASSGQVFSANPDGSDLKVIVSEGRRLPDGIVVDVAAGHLYWTNMGNPSANDGSIERANLDGSNITHIVPPGGTFTPKQLQLDEKNRKLYWCDREGMRIMRANLDGSKIETLIDTSEGDARPGKDIKKWCVGIALDVEAGKLYWTQKGPDNAGEGRIFRANLEIPKARLRPVAKTSNSSMRAYPNLSTSNWTSPTGRSTGRTAAIHRAATR